MKLYLMRHGEASYASASNDGDWMLTEMGRLEVACAAEYFADKVFDLVWVSPLKRAQQTWGVVSARVTAKQLNLSAEVRPESDPCKLLSQLAEAAVGEYVLLITHQPFVGRLASLLVEGQMREQPIGTAGVFVIEAEVPIASAGTLVEQIML